VDKSERIYHRTEAGTLAAWLTGSRLPRSVLALLRSVGPAMPAREIAGALGRHDKAQIVERLEDLEAIGLVESVSVEWLAELVELATCAAGPR
jgi:hypothetical protein